VFSNKLAFSSGQGRRGGRTVETRGFCWVDHNWFRRRRGNRCRGRVPEQRPSCLCRNGYGAGTCGTLWTVVSKVGEVLFYLVLAGADEG